MTHHKYLMIIEVDNHTHLLFLDCVRFDVRAHTVVAIKLHVKLEYIPHDSSVVPTSDEDLSHVFFYDQTFVMCTTSQTVHNCEVCVIR